MLAQQVTGNNVQTGTVHFRLIKKIKDERFDEEALHLYTLCLHIGVRDFQVLVTGEENRVLLLEDYVLPEVASANALQHTLADIFESHAVLKAGFWAQVKICFKTQKFVQVPAALFAEESMHEYLLFNAQVDAQTETVLKVEHANKETITVFAAYTDLLSWLLSCYPSLTPIVLHQSAALIDGVLTLANPPARAPLYVYIDRFKLHIIACNKGKLVYYNQFVVNQFQDYVRYIMLVLKSLKMDQRTSEVVLWGYIGKNSPHYHEFYKFINNVRFGDRPAHLRFSYMFDEVPEHSFFDLYSCSLLGN
jgi:hypothetical protein